MSNIQDDVKEAIASKIANQNDTVSALHYRKIKKGDSPWFVAMCILAVLFSIAAMGGVYYYKKYKAQPEVAQIQGEKAVTVQDLRTGIKPLLDTQDKKINDLEKRVDVIANRQWLLSVAHNENAAITEAVTSRVAPDLKDKHILIDSEWKLNRIPEFSKLSEEDKRSLMGR